jgi:hypothetical protein
LKETFLKIATDLWIATSRMRYYGLQIGTRMSIIRLSNGGLWLHSPVALSQELLVRLQELGEIRWVVAPNRFHHLFVSDYIKSFPQAKFYGAPGLSEKRPDLKFNGELGETAEPDWAGQIDQKLIQGFRFFSEVIFFHRASRSLILTDLITHFTEGSAFSIRLLAKCLGFYNRPAFLFAFKKRIARRPELRASLQALLEWDFVRILPAHGEILSVGAKEAFEKLLGQA